MNTAADAFGYILVTLSALLAAWEIRTHARGRRERDWLSTPRRHRRRLAIAAVFACIGVLMLLQSKGLVPLDAARPVIGAVYLGSILLLSVVIVVLAIADLAETTNAASSMAMKDLEEAIEEQELRKLALGKKADSDDSAAVGGRTGGSGRDGRD